jgi:hypothetical protein
MGIDPSKIADWHIRNQYIGPNTTISPAINLGTYGL